MAKLNINLVPTQMIATELIDNNTGQIAGVKANPRVLRDDKFRKLKKSIQDNPKMMALRELMVFEHEGRFVTIGGNQRLEALRSLKIAEAPCKVIPADTTPEQLNAYIVLDNAPFGEWDWDMLANQWDAADLSDWGVDFPQDWANPMENTNSVEDENNHSGTSKEKIEDVERLLDDAMLENVKEALEQIKLTLAHGFLVSGITTGMCKAKFIRAKYYGEPYPRYLSFYFHPWQYQTGQDGKNALLQLEKIASGETKAGVAGLRTSSTDGNITTTTTTSCSYPWFGMCQPLDFNANKAADLIREFGCGRVLDPCHGWGGRLVGALLADAKSYTGIDPSDEAHIGVTRIADAYGIYQKTTIKLIKKPYEDTDLQDAAYDIAITSPPYFDVEQYHGEEQSHVRYNTYQKWVKGFYEPLIMKTFAALKKGGVFCLQVGSQIYPLLKDGTDIAERVGFIVEDIRPLGGQTSTTLHGNTDDDETNEKIIILRKKTNG